MKNNIIDTLSFLLILLWIYAAVSKLTDYPLFENQLSKQPLPAWSIGILAWLLPAIEITAALLLAFSRTRRLGFFISLLLLLSFTLYTGFALSGAYGSIPCSCGGIFSFMGWKGHFVFNAIAMLLAFAGWYLNYRKFDLVIFGHQKYFTRKREVS